MTNAPPDTLLPRPHASKAAAAARTVGPLAKATGQCDFGQTESHTRFGKSASKSSDWEESNAS
jgi:hypothetical protein